MAEPADSYLIARETTPDHLSADPEILGHLRQIHHLVVAANPDVLVKRRAQGESIYVHPGRRHDSRYKNLLTLWVEQVGVRIHILPGEKETNDPRKRGEYLARLLECDRELRERAGGDGQA